MNYENPDNFTVKLTPNLINLATEGSLDTSILNGVSVQRTINMFMVTDSQNNMKIFGNLKDGSSFDTVVSSISGWRTIIDTIWLYPVVDLNLVLENYRPSIIEIGDRIIFEDINELYSFYYDVFYQTSISQPIGNIGYSLGVGTELRDLGTTIHLETSSGLRIVTWRLVEQLTPQSTLPSGADSPDGTIGFILIYCDWNEDGSQDPLDLNPADLGFTNGDPLRVEAI